MKIIVSGGSGFIGAALIDELLKNGHYAAVWSRKPGRHTRDSVATHHWDPEQGEPPLESLTDFDAIVHLAGEPLAQRWNPEVKRRILTSRVQSTLRLAAALEKVKRRPTALICASAVGYYGDRGDEILTEEAAAGVGFLSNVCREWEAAADSVEQLGLRVFKIRIGVALGAGGGALAKMMPLFKGGLGGTLGSGKQWMSWIHRDDLVNMLRYGIENEVSGTWNGAAPNPVTNAVFTRELGRALHRSAFLPVPAFAIRALYGEMADVVLSSQRVVPEKAARAGFQFRYADVASALSAAVMSG